MMLDLGIIAWKNISQKRTRSFLTIIGVVIGVGAIVAMVSISKGFEDSVREIMEQFGADNITILPGSSFTTASTFAPTPLTDRDVEAVRRVHGVKKVVGIAAETVDVEVGPEKAALMVYSYPAEAYETFFGKIKETYIESGRPIRKNDKFVATIGYGVAHEVFEKDLEPGRSIYINGKMFRIVGVMRKAGSQQDDMSINIPLEAFREISRSEDETYFMMLAKLRPGADPEGVAEEIQKRLKQLRGKEDFQVVTSEDLMKQVSGILGGISAVVIAIAAIAIFVGAVGITNTMYMSVMDRTREIGVMKAVGAKKWQIITIFLIEAGVMGLIGAITGGILGAGFAKLIGYGVREVAGIFYYSAYVGPDLFAGAAVFGLIIGVVAGFLPAKRAAELNPVEALRYE